MNVLIVDEEVPWPLNTGKRLRTYNLVRRLQKKHNITYLCYGYPEQVLPECPNVNLITLPSPILEQKGTRFYWALFTNFFSPRPYIVDRHYSREMELRVLSLVASEKYDLVHCEWTPYTENIRQLIGTIPSLLSAHNVEAQIWERYYQTTFQPFKKAYIYLQWRKLLGYEARASRCYSTVSTVSEPDMKRFVNDYGCQQVTVVPNGVDESYFVPQQGQVAPGSMVFTGSMDWRPNQDGIKFFIEEIFPLIRQQLPHATITAVGRKPPQWLVDMAGRTNGVLVTGTVADVRPYIANASLYVVPLRVGGGSRLKILEALSMEKPVLSTTVGAEGLAVEDGKHLLLRDLPQAFAATACTMLSEPARFSGLGVEGRKLILNKYTWDAIAEIMSDTWERACG